MNCCTGMVADNECFAKQRLSIDAAVVRHPL